MDAQCYVWVTKNYSRRMMDAQWGELLGMDWGRIGQLEGQRGNAYSGTGARDRLGAVSWEARVAGILPGMYGVILAGEKGVEAVGNRQIPGNGPNRPVVRRMAVWLPT